MKCTSCGSKVIEATTTSVTDLGSCIVIVRNVPCYKCAECNEVIYTLDVAERLEQIIDKAKRVCYPVPCLMKSGGGNRPDEARQPGMPGAKSYGTAGR